MRHLVCIAVICFLTVGSSSCTPFFGRMGRPSESDFLWNRNRANMQKLAVDMTRKEVNQIMGEKHWHDLFDTPYKVESVPTTLSSEPVTAVYYYTGGDLGSGRDVTDDELTPVYFRNGKVTGWGRGMVVM